MDLGRHLLLVEDNPLEATHMRRLISDNGYVVDIASNGLDALDQMRVRPPSVVITDLQMPEMDGLELVERIQEEFPSVPVILITGVGSEEVATEALNRGTEPRNCKLRSQA